MDGLIRFKWIVAIAWLIVFVDLISRVGALDLFWALYIDRGTLSINVSQKMRLDLSSWPYISKLNHSDARMVSI